MFYQSPYLFIFFQTPFFCNFIEDTKLMLSPFWSPLWPQLSLGWWGDSGWEPVTRKTKYWITDGNFQPHADLQPLTSGGKGLETEFYKESWTKGFRALPGWCSVEVQCLSLSPTHRVTLSSSEKDELSALPVQVQPAPGIELGDPGQGRTRGTASPLWVLLKVFHFSPQSAACFLQSSGSSVLSRGCTEHGHVLLRGWHWGFHGQ